MDKERARQCNSNEEHILKDLILLAFPRSGDVWIMAFKQIHQCGW